MQQKIINMLSEDVKFEIQTDTRLSFKPFLKFLREHLQEKDSVKKELFEFVLQKFESFDDIEADKSLEEISQHKPLLDLLYVVLTNLTEDEKNIYWGLCVPMSPVMFYGSDLFFELLSNANMQDKQCGLHDEDFDLFIKSKFEHFYAFILKKFYGIGFQLQNKLVRNMKDDSCGITRHFSINLNTEFVEVKVKGELPEIDVEMIRKHGMEDDSIPVLQKLLPVDMFSFSGFTIMTITDITAQFALDNIRDSIVSNRAEGNGHDFSETVQSLKELVGCNDIEFNLMPMFRVNGRLAEDMDVYNRSVLLSAKYKNLVSDKVCMGMIEKFSSNPVLIYYFDLEEQGPSQPEVLNILQKENIKSYALFPVFYNKKLVGAVEMYCRQKGMLEEKRLSQLEPAKELLAQILYNSIAAQEAEIETVIKEKYTRIQPAVQWKFNETAWRYLQNKKAGTADKMPETEVIGFSDVYPLYGAVDIRNSTLERNTALLKDFSLLFEVLLKVLNTLKEKTGFGLLDEKIFKVKKWDALVKPNDPGFNQQVKLNDFLEHEIAPFLVSFTESRVELKEIAAAYFSAVDEKTGVAHKNRRQLEASMTTVISAVNNYFDRLKEEIQQAYPCYFEKFRTDGVEYDIYIGQSISPDLPYSDIYLKNLRLMQLSSMAAITKYTHALLPQLDNAIETTQLIFIHSQPIDILFRNDEKRFDVEGAYNIRYQVIKKRIDKVHLLDSDERLTQPGKIALVYFSDKEADEYISYIKYLQGNDILNNDLEKLELEELSGVSGLKALRVGVNLAQTAKSKPEVSATFQLDVNEKN